MTHCCAHMHCIDSREAVGLRLMLNVLNERTSDGIHNGGFAREAGLTRLDRIGTALDRVGAAVLPTVDYDPLWRDLENLDGMLQEIDIPVCDRNEVCTNCRVKV